MKPTSKPSVFQYADYVPYLRDLRAWWKSQGRPASLRRLEVYKEDGGRYSAQFLAAVFRGDKPMPEHLARELARLFRLEGCACGG